MASKLVGSVIACLGLLFAFVLWPDGALDRPLASLPVGSMLRIAASLAIGATSVYIGSLFFRD